MSRARVAIPLLLVVLLCWPLCSPGVESCAGVAPGEPRPGNSQADEADALYKQGLALYKKGQLDAAIASYRKALQLKPDDPDVHYNLGNALYDKGQLDEAIAAYQKALQLRPEFPEAHFNLGLALRAAGREEEAQRQFAEAQRLDPRIKPPK